MWKIILTRLFKQGKIDETVLDNCVAEALITEEEKNEILGIVPQE